MKFGCNQRSSFRWGGRLKLWTDDGRTTEPAYTISSPGAFGSGELKKTTHFLASLCTCKSYVGMQCSCELTDSFPDTASLLLRLVLPGTYCYTSFGFKLRGRHCKAHIL